MTVNEFIKKDSWILTVIRDRCELTNAEKDYLNILIGALEEEPKTEGARGDIPIQQTVPPMPKENRVEYGTDGNPYKLSISNGKEYEKEPCEDMKRKVEKEYLFESLCEDLKKLQAENEKLRKVIDQTPKTNWIPVSERLPKIASVYIVTRHCLNEGYLVDACFFDGSNTWYDDNRLNHGRAYVNDIIAWQEKPEPYKESEGRNDEEKRNGEDA